MLLLLTGLADSQVGRGLFGRDGEFVHVLPPLGLVVFVFLLVAFLLLLLDLHFLHKQGQNQSFTTILGFYETCSCDNRRYLLVNVRLS